MKGDFNYQRYLASREWALLKRQVKERACGRYGRTPLCERCGDGNAPVQAVHHLTYERLGRELLDDLVGLCRPCHAYLSAESAVDPLDILRAEHEDYLAHYQAQLAALPADATEEERRDREWNVEAATWDRDVLLIWNDLALRNVRVDIDEFNRLSAPINEIHIHA